MLWVLLCPVQFLWCLRVSDCQVSWEQDLDSDCIFIWFAINKSTTSLRLSAVLVYAHADVLECTPYDFISGMCSIGFESNRQVLGLRCSC